MFQPTPMSSAPTSYGLAQPQNSMAPSQQPTMDSNPNVATMPNAYARGGSTKRGKLVMAHFNPKELDTMDHLQGKQERCPRSGMRSYTHLEELLKNPHLLSTLHGHVHAKKHAAGGSAHGGHEDYHNQSLNQMAGHGVHGDTELALIGPHTHNVFSRLAEHGTVTNHTDGRPQYWSLGGTLSGLWDTIKGGARAAAPYIGAIGKSVLPAVMPALQGIATGMGGPMGGMAAGALGGLASKGFDALSNMGSDQHRALANTAGEGVQSAVQARQQGASLPQAAGAGLSRFGARFDGGAGGGMRGVGDSLQRGNGAFDTLKSGARGAYEGSGGSNGLMDAAKGLMSQYRGGANPRQMMGTTMQRGMQSLRNSPPTPQSMSNQDAFAQLPFANDYA